MFDIEDEFNKLMEEVKNKIQEKQDSGEYSKWDAQDLTEKVDSIISRADTSRYGNTCPDGHSDPECGWSPSMGYHCF
jgi:hypothetical protein